MKTGQVNTFTGGINTDLNPVLQPKDTLTDCVNGTIITYNDNENMLQNDMGNYKLKNAKLPEGYIPLGMKEYGGILYLVLANPKTGKVQLGSYPSPQTKPEEIYDSELDDDNLYEINPVSIQKFDKNDIKNFDFFSEEAEKYFYSKLDTSNSKVVFTSNFGDDSTFEIGDKFAIAVDDIEEDPVFQELKYFSINKEKTKYSLDEDLLKIEPVGISDENELIENWDKDDKYLKQVSWQFPGWIGCEYVVDNLISNLQDVDVDLKQIDSKEWIFNTIQKNEENKYILESEYSNKISSVTESFKEIGTDEIWLELPMGKESLIISDLDKYDIESISDSNYFIEIKFKTPVYSVEFLEEIIKGVADKIVLPSTILFIPENIPTYMLFVNHHIIKVPDSFKWVKRLYTPEPLDQSIFEKNIVYITSDDSILSEGDTYESNRGICGCEFGCPTFKDKSKLKSICTPSEIDLTIPDEWLRDAALVEFVGILNNVKQFGMLSFYNCEGTLYVNSNLNNIYSDDNDSTDGPFTESKFSRVIFGKNVVDIGNFAFSLNNNLNKVYFSENLRTIWDSAFAKCPIDNLNFPSTLTTIGTWAFSNCKTKNIIIPENVQYIDEFAFGSSDESPEIQNVTILGQLTSFAACVFKNCGKGGKLILNTKYINAADSSPFFGSKFDTVEIRGKRVTVQEYAFASCWSIKTVHLYADTCILEKSCFIGCTNLDDIHVYGNIICNSTIFEDSPQTRPRPVLTIYNYQPNLNIGRLKDLFENRCYSQDVQISTVPIKLELRLTVKEYEEQIRYKVTGDTRANFNYSTGQFTLDLSQNRLIPNYFQSLSSLYQLHIPRGVHLGDNCFGECRNLSTVNFDTSIDYVFKPITQFGSGTSNPFSNCSKVHFPKTLEKLDLGGENFQNTIHLYFYSYSSPEFTDNTMRLLDNENVYIHSLWNVPWITKANWEIFNNSSADYDVADNEILYENVEEIDIDKENWSEDIELLYNEFIYTIQGSNRRGFRLFFSENVKFGTNVFLNSNISELVIPNTCTYLCNTFTSSIDSLNKLILGKHIRRIRTYIRGKNLNRVYCKTPYIDFESNGAAINPEWLFPFSNSDLKIFVNKNEIETCKLSNNRLNSLVTKERPNKFFNAKELSINLIHNYVHGISPDGILRNEIITHSEKGNVMTINFIGSDESKYNLDFHTSYGEYIKYINIPCTISSFTCSNIGCKSLYIKNSSEIQKFENSNLKYLYVDMIPEWQYDTNIDVLLVSDSEVFQTYLNYLNEISKFEINAERCTIVNIVNDRIELVTNNALEEFASMLNIVKFKNILLYNNRIQYVVPFSEKYEFNPISDNSEVELKLIDGSVKYELSIRGKNIVTFEKNNRIYDNLKVWLKCNNDYITPIIRNRKEFENNVQFEFEYNFTKISSLSDFKNVVITSIPYLLNDDKNLLIFDNHKISENIFTTASKSESSLLLYKYYSSYKYDVSNVVWNIDVKFDRIEQDLEFNIYEFENKKPRLKFHKKIEESSNLFIWSDIELDKNSVYMFEISNLKSGEKFKRFLITYDFSKSDEYLDTISDYKDLYLDDFLIESEEKLDGWFEYKFGEDPKTSSKVVLGDKYHKIDNHKIFHSLICDKMYENPNDIIDWERKKENTLKIIGTDKFTKSMSEKEYTVNLNINYDNGETVTIKDYEFKDRINGDDISIIEQSVVTKLIQDPNKTVPIRKYLIKDSALPSSTYDENGNYRFSEWKEYLLNYMASDLENDDKSGSYLYIEKCDGGKEIELSYLKNGEWSSKTICSHEYDIDRFLNSNIKKSQLFIPFKANVSSKKSGFLVPMPFLKNTTYKKKYVWGGTKKLNNEAKFYAATRNPGKSKEAAKAWTVGALLVLAAVLTVATLGAATAIGIGAVTTILSLGVGGVLAWGIGGTAVLAGAAYLANVAKWNDTKADLMGYVIKAKPNPASNIKLMLPLWGCKENQEWYFINSDQEYNLDEFLAKFYTHAYYYSNKEISLWNPKTTIYKRIKSVEVKIIVSDGTKCLNGVFSNEWNDNAYNLIGIETNNFINSSSTDEEIRSQIIEVAITDELDSIESEINDSNNLLKNDVYDNRLHIDGISDNALKTDSKYSKLKSFIDRIIIDEDENIYFELNKDRENKLLWPNDDACFGGNRGDAKMHVMRYDGNTKIKLLEDVYQRSYEDGFCPIMYPLDIEDDSILNNKELKKPDFGISEGIPEYLKYLINYE